MKSYNIIPSSLNFDANNYKQPKISTVDSYFESNLTEDAYYSLEVFCANWPFLREWMSASKHRWMLSVMPEKSLVDLKMETSFEKGFIIN